MQISLFALAPFALASVLARPTPAESGWPSGGFGGPQQGFDHPYDSYVQKDETQPPQPLIIPQLHGPVGYHTGAATSYGTSSAPYESGTDRRPGMETWSGVHMPPVNSFGSDTFGQLQIPSHYSSGDQSGRHTWSYSPEGNPMSPQYYGGYSAGFDPHVRTRNPYRPGTSQRLQGRTSPMTSMSANHVYPPAISPSDERQRLVQFHPQASNRVHNIQSSSTDIPTTDYDGWSMTVPPWAAAGPSLEDLYAGVEPYDLSHERMFSLYGSGTDQRDGAVQMNAVSEPSTIGQAQFPHVYTALSDVPGYTEAKVQAPRGGLESTPPSADMFAQLDRSSGLVRTPPRTRTRATGPGRVKNASRPGRDVESAPAFSGPSTQRPQLPSSRDPAQPPAIISKATAEQLYRLWKILLLISWYCTEILGENGEKVLSFRKAPGIKCYEGDWIAWQSVHVNKQMDGTIVKNTCFQRHNSNKPEDKTIRQIRAKDSIVGCFTWEGDPDMDGNQIKALVTASKRLAMARENQ